jgi:uncharacterized membrane protein
MMKQKINILAILGMILVITSSFLVSAHTEDDFYGHHMMDGMYGMFGYGGMGIFGLVLWILVIVILVLLIVWLTKQIQK